MHKIQKEAESIKEQVIAECEELKRKTLEDARNLQRKSLKENPSIYSIYRYCEIKCLEPDYNLWIVKDIKTLKKGVIDIEGTQRIPCIYDDIIAIMEGTNNLIVLDNNYYGLVDLRGRIVIKPQYNDFNRDFNRNLWNVKLEDKWGYIDYKGNTIIPFQYDNSATFLENKAEVEQNGEKFYINTLGERIENI